MTKNDIHSIRDIARLRYNMVRIYDLPEFNGTLKAFVMTQLDAMIGGELPSGNFIAMQQRIRLRSQN